MTRSDKPSIGSYTRSSASHARISAWYYHAAEGAMDNDQVKVLWDFKVQTDHHLQHNRTDIVVLEKERTCSVIDVSCHFDTRVLEKEQEKMKKISRPQKRNKEDLEL